MLICIMQVIFEHCAQHYILTNTISFTMPMCVCVVPTYIYVCVCGAGVCANGCGPSISNQ